MHCRFCLGQSDKKTLKSLTVRGRRGAYYIVKLCSGCHKNRVPDGSGILIFYAGQIYRTEDLDKKGIRYELRAGWRSLSEKKGYLKEFLKS